MLPATDGGTPSLPFLYNNRPYNYENINNIMTQFPVGLSPLLNDNTFLELKPIPAPAEGQTGNNGIGFRRIAPQ